MRITIIGTGYVGLVSGTSFAELGYEVACVDIDEKKVALLQQGQIPIYEPGLSEMFVRNQEAGRLHVTTNLSEALKGSTVVFLALPTPMAEDGSADLSYIFKVADQLGPLLQEYTVIVNKSTVPVGTAEKVQQRIARSAAAPFDVISNPEFLREGLAINDFMSPDRIIVGCSSQRARAVIEVLYKPITDKGFPLYLMSERSAEMAKYAANSFLAAKITFMNQIANLAERSGANIDDIRLGVGSDSRIGPKFLNPGIGYGGSCFPKDVQALIHTAKEYGYDFKMLKTVIQENQAQKKVLIHKVLNYFAGDITGKTLAIWGLAFKPETDDIREAPAIEMIRSLTAAGAKVRAYDPQAMTNTATLFSDNDTVELVTDPYAAIRGADALLIATEWQEFNTVSLGKIKELLARPVVFDGRNIFSPTDMQSAGFHYESIGRPAITSAL